MHSIRKIAARIAVVLAFVLVLEQAVRFCYDDWNASVVLSRGHRKELEGTLDTVYCGTSIVYRSISPKVLDEKLGTNSYNLGSSSQPLWGTYYLIQEAAERNPIRNIYLLLSLPTFKMSRTAESYVSAYETLYTLKWKLKYALSLKDEKLMVPMLFYSTQVKWYLDPEKVFTNIKNKLFPPNVDNILEERGFRGLDKVYDGRPRKQDVNGVNYWNGEQGASQIQEESLTYLKKIMAFCKEKGIHLTLVMPPFTQNYLDGAGDLDNMNQVISELADEWDVPFYNFILYKNRMTEYTDEKFNDWVHMDRVGGLQFSALLADVISSEHPEEYFYSSMDEFKE